MLGSHSYSPEKAFYFFHFQVILAHLSKTLLVSRLFISRLYNSTGLPFIWPLSLFKTLMNYSLKMKASHHSKLNLWDCISFHDGTLWSLRKEFFKILICKNFVLFLCVTYTNLLSHHFYIQSNYDFHLTIYSFRAQSALLLWQELRKCIH